MMLANLLGVLLRLIGPAWTRLPWVAQFLLGMSMYMFSFWGLKESWVGQLLTDGIRTTVMQWVGEVLEEYIIRPFRVAFHWGIVIVSYALVGLFGWMLIGRVAAFWNPEEDKLSSFQPAKQKSVQLTTSKRLQRLWLSMVLITCGSIAYLDYKRNPIVSTSQSQVREMVLHATNSVAALAIVGNASMSTATVQLEQARQLYERCTDEDRKLKQTDDCMQKVEDAIEEMQHVRDTLQVSLTTTTELVTKTTTPDCEGDTGELHGIRVKLQCMFRFCCPKQQTTQEYLHDKPQYYILSHDVDNHSINCDTIPSKKQTKCSVGSGIFASFVWGAWVDCNEMFVHFVHLLDCNSKMKHDIDTKIAELSDQESTRTTHWLEFFADCTRCLYSHVLPMLDWKGRRFRRPSGRRGYMIAALYHIGRFVVLVAMEALIKKVVNLQQEEADTSSSSSVWLAFQTMMVTIIVGIELVYYWLNNPVAVFDRSLPFKICFGRIQLNAGQYTTDKTVVLVFKDKTTGHFLGALDEQGGERKFIYWDNTKWAGLRNERLKCRKTHMTLIDATKLLPGQELPKGMYRIPISEMSGYCSSCKIEPMGNGCFKVNTWKKLQQESAKGKSWEKAFLSVDEGVLERHPPAYTPPTGIKSEVMNAECHETKPEHGNAKPEATGDDNPPPLEPPSHLGSVKLEPSAPP